MQAEKSDPMKDALASRRGKGVELIIGINPHHEMQGDAPMIDDDARKTQDGRGDLAPPPEGKMSGMESAAGMHAPLPGGGIADQHEMAPGDVPMPDDAKAHFAQHMSEEDIKNMAHRKPRSLGERARQMAFMKRQ